MIMLKRARGKVSEPNKLSLKGQQMFGFMEVTTEIPMKMDSVAKVFKGT